MAGPGEATRYRYYSSGERVHNKTMEEWLKYSVSLTEFRSNGEYPTVKYIILTPHWESLYRGNHHFIYYPVIVIRELAQDCDN